MKQFDVYRVKSSRAGGTGRLAVATTELPPWSGVAWGNASETSRHTATKSFPPSTFSSPATEDRHGRNHQSACRPQGQGPCREGDARGREPRPLRPSAPGDD